MTDKTQWTGVVTSIQPRIRLTRSFDQADHSYLGYVVRLQGTIGDDSREFMVAIGKGAHAKHQLRIGMSVSGEGVPVADAQMETAELYKISKLKVLDDSSIVTSTPPPWLGIPPDLQVYRARGHRRLEARTYKLRCSSCIWGCRMPVAMIVDHWNPSQRRYRFETFCYGPKSCASYRAGRRRVVPGRRGMSWEEPDWIDEEATRHRGEDE